MYWFNNRCIHSTTNVLTNNQCIDLTTNLLIQQPMYCFKNQCNDCIIQSNVCNHLSIYWITQPNYYITNKCISRLIVRANLIFVFNRHLDFYVTEWNARFMHFVTNLWICNICRVIERDKKIRLLSFWRICKLIWRIEFAI